MAQVMKARGTRDEVWEGIARATSGGLVKADLRKNARGVLVSIKQSDAAKARAKSGRDALGRKASARWEQCGHQPGRPPFIHSSHEYHTASRIART